MRRALSIIVWSVVAACGAVGYAMMAWGRGENVNSVHVLLAAFCTYAIGFRFYSKWIAARVLALEDRRATPCEVHDDGKDFVKTNRWIVFGHHFAAISGPGPLVGPVLASQFGFLPGALWILIGVVLGGAVQDFVILFCSIRRNGRSLGQMVKDELNTPSGVIALFAILAIMVILLAVLALVVVRALAESPWGVFTVAATIPIAVFMGGYLRFLRVGRVLEVSVLGVVLLLLAVWGGRFVHGHPVLSEAFTLKAEPLAWAVIVYGLAASILPVWLLLAPRDYLSTFMKLGTIFALAIGTFLVLPDLKMPAVTSFVDGSGPIVSGKLFPFCFITIACGSISGFHSLIASGTTPKMITREGHARSIGYGAMLLESLVAIMALIAACSLEPGVYLAMNIKGAGADAAAVAADTVVKVRATGFDVDPAGMDALAQAVGEKTLYGRTGGAATLAVGMAAIFSSVTAGRWLDLWYHFAIMFEALFILTTIDAGTRVGRYILQDALGGLWKPLGRVESIPANLVASALMVGGWGFFLIQGVRDPLGGINSLWPLFGIANQMLAAIALCLATTVIMKMQIAPPNGPDGQPARSIAKRPDLALITLIPLVWLLAVTMTAGVQKIYHPDKRIGFLSAASDLAAKEPALRQAVEVAPDDPARAAAARELARNRTLQFNNRLDAAVAATFLGLVTIIVALSLRAWVLMWTGHKRVALRETQAVWLSPAAAAEGGQPVPWFHVFALLFGLARELTVEAELDRTQQAGIACRHDADRPNPPDAGRLYAKLTDERYRGIRRCC
jgi:carbon starvation protein